MAPREDIDLPVLTLVGDDVASLGQATAAAELEELQRLLQRDLVLVLGTLQTARIGRPLDGEVATIAPATYTYGGLAGGEVALVYLDRVGSLTEDGVRAQQLFVLDL